jgi:Fe2+ or Zn2+ uptake regulation protein
MRRKMTLNEQKIVRLIKNSRDPVRFTDIEKVMDFNASKDKYWSVFSTVACLVESGIITTTRHPSIYSLTKYGRMKYDEIT